MNPRPLYSVVVPSYLSSQTIGACLTALVQQDFSRPYEIIVVDSSPDDTPNIVRRSFPQVQLIHLARRADPAMARNIGAAQAQGEILAFIDSDCVASLDWLSRLNTVIEQGYDAVGGAVANGNGETDVSWAGYLCEFREFLPGQPSRDAANLTLGNAAYHRSVFWACGGFPSGYFPQEDQVFHHTLLQRGARTRFDPQIIVAHTHRSERRAFLLHQWQIGEANALVLRRIRLPGAFIARRSRFAFMAVPFLTVFRFMRTIHACRGVENSLVFRRFYVLWLCWLGMCWWGRGFLHGTMKLLPGNEMRG